MSHHRYHLKAFIGQQPNPAATALVSKLPSAVVPLFTFTSSSSQLRETLFRHFVCHNVTHSSLSEPLDVHLCCTPLTGGGVSTAVTAAIIKPGGLLLATVPVSSNISHTLYRLTLALVSCKPMNRIVFNRTSPTWQISGLTPYLSNTSRIHTL